MPRRPYRVLGSDDALVRLAVREPMAAADLLRAAGVSRTEAARALAAGRVGREGERLAGGDPLAAGDVVDLALAVADPSWPDVEPAAVAWDDPAGVLLAADKPAGLLVHGDGTGAETLRDRVQARLAADGRVRDARPVQRIDVDTSGLVLFCLAREFQAAVDAQVADGSMEKRYLAVLAGTLERPLSVDRPVGRDRHDARRMHVGSGKDALTRFVPLAAGRAGGRPVTLVEARIATGRRHQIRAHGAWAGHPVLGDPLYGGPSWGAGLMLHAWRETLRHPLTGATVRLEAPVPPRFGALFPRWEP